QMLRSRDRAGGAEKLYVGHWLRDYIVGKLAWLRTCHACQRWRRAWAVKTAKAWPKPKRTNRENGEVILARPRSSPFAWYNRRNTSSWTLSKSATTFAPEISGGGVITLGFFILNFGGGSKLRANQLPNQPYLNGPLPYSCRERACTMAVSIARKYS